MIVIVEKFRKCKIIVTRLFTNTVRIIDTQAKKSNMRKEGKVQNNNLYRL